jgi:erythromycin esterase
MTIVRALLGMVLAIVGALAGCAQAPPEESVADWIGRTAAPLEGVAPDIGAHDLVPLASAVGDAQIVGLGESTHGVSEEITLKHRALRMLVTDLGFRSVAWEEDWTLGLEINDYLRTGAGSVDALVRRMSPQWQSREVADVLRWLREFNADRPDQVQFVGVEYYATPAQAHDLLDAYVARVAPHLLPALRAHLSAIRPGGADVYEYIRWYADVADKQPYVDHARQALDLVAGIPRPAGDHDHSVAVHAAQEIVAFYRHYQLSAADGLVRRDAHVAENISWWRRLTEDKIVYWAASPHTANAPRLRISGPPAPDLRFPSAGSHLHRWYGPGYCSIGVTVGSGAASLGPGDDALLPSPGPGRFERPLVDAGLATFVLDLRTPAPAAARAWLDEPATFRGLPDGGPDAAVDGGAPAEWFDVIMHSQVATPTRPAT